MHACSGIRTFGRTVAVKITDLYKNSNHPPREARLLQAKAQLARAGEIPLVINIGKLSSGGDIVLSDQQVSRIRQVSANPENRLLDAPAPPRKRLRACVFLLRRCL